MKIGKIQQAELIEKLQSLYGNVRLLCDGFEVTLCVERSKGLACRVVTYVNGQWCGKWVSGTESFPEQKFLNRRERSLVTPAKKAEAEKALGKRYVAKSPFYSAKIVIYDISWPSGRAAINHLMRVCDSVQVAPVAQTEEA